MSATLTTTLFQLSSWDARLNLQFVLASSKLLVGSDPRCDIVLTGKGISGHHCYLIVDVESVRVIDLASTNGTFVNGKRIKEGTLFLGDTLTIADIALNVGQAISDQTLTNAEAAVAGLNSAVAQSSMSVPDRAGLTLIDQEYCDLDLNATDLATPARFDVGQESEEELDSVDRPLDLVEGKTKDRIEVITYSCGNVLDVSYVDLDKGGPILSPSLAKGKIWFPGIKADVALLKSEGKVWHINCPEGFSLQGKSELSSESVFLTLGVHQVSLRLVDQTFKVNPLPFLWRDRAFYKEAGKIAAGVFIPFLLLLLITVPEMVPEETKQITIVYKAIKEADGESKQEISATEVTSQTENTGAKATEQAKTQPQMSAAAAAASSQQAPSEPAAAAPAKPKAYSFKSSVSLDSVVSDAAPADTNSAATGRSPAATGKGFGASSGALSGKATGTGVAVGTLGSDASGSAAASAGAKGLVSKKGFDHSYLEPKTVVLGSMDPELLRKILQEYLPQFRHCYQQELITAAKDIKGVIDLDFQISPDGRVSRTNVKAKDARFTKKGMDCMATVLKIIEFPKPKGGGVVDVRQPLNFFAETEKI